MKKYQSIVAACCVLGAVPAVSQAQNVTLSGYLNLGVTKVTEQNIHVDTVSRSSLTFSGKEDLGGGNYATFRLQPRFEIDTGMTERPNRPFFQGESTVGLSSKTFGSVRLGRALSPIGAWDGSYDSWAVFDRIASPAWWFFIPDYVPDPRAGETASYDYGRISNGVFYDSPTFSGFHFHLTTAAGESSQTKARHYGGSFNYDKNDLSLMFAAEQNSQKDRAYFLGSAYKLGPAKLMAGYSQVSLNRDGTVYGADYANWAAASRPAKKRNSLVLTSSYDIDVSTIQVGAGRDFQGSTNGFNYIGSNFTKAGTNYSGASNFFSVGYLYNLSKRTSLFADAALVNWKYTDDNGHRKATGLAVGMNHGF